MALAKVKSTFPEDFLAVACLCKRLSRRGNRPVFATHTTDTLLNPHHRGPRDVFSYVIL